MLIGCVILFFFYLKKGFLMNNSTYEICVNSVLKLDVLAELITNHF